MEIQRTVFRRLVAERQDRAVSILLGPRQVGKTWLLRQLEAHFRAEGARTCFYNLELPADSMFFNQPDAALYGALTRDVDVVFIDEFHYLKNASRLFKAIHDGGAPVKIYASGSSSIEIHRHLQESLAGRRLVTRIHPLSYGEFLQTGSSDPLTEYLRFGGLPGLVHLDGPDAKMRHLEEMLQAYILKDIRSLVHEENVRAFNTLMYLLAENQGSLTVVDSLAREVGLTARTIAHHLSLLEHTYAAVSVPSWSGRPGNELKKSRKVWLYDAGIRNMLIKDFSPPATRADAGSLYEWFVFRQLAINLAPNMELRFWRDKQGREIDFLLLTDRRPLPVEVKAGDTRGIVPAALSYFLGRYPDCAGGVVFHGGEAGEVTVQGRPVRFLPHTAAASFAG